MQPPNNVAPIRTRNQRYALSNSRSIQPDMYRTKFRALERQVEENQPGEMGLGFVGQARDKAQADIDNQFKSGSENVQKMGPDTSTFMPTFDRAVGGNSEARTQTANNLQAFLPEYKPMDIDTAMEDDAQSLLGQQNRGGYLTALMEDRGGGLSGANRLDASILDRSGAGRRQFEEARKQLAGFADQGKALQGQLTGQYDQKKADLKAAQDAVLSAVGLESGKLRSKADQKIAEQTQALPIEEIAAIKAEAQAMRPDLRVGDLQDYQPHLDRDLSFEEALSGSDAETYNYLSELAGRGPTLFRGQDPTINRASLLNAFIQEGQNFKSRSEEQAREAIRAKTRAEENRKQEEHKKIVTQAEHNKRHNAGGPKQRGGRAGDA